MAVLVGVLAGVGVGATLFLLERSGSGDDEPTDAHAFLERVAAALRGLGDVPHVSGVATVQDGQGRHDLWSSEAWYDFTADVVRSAMKKAPGNSLDIADEAVQIRAGEYVYDAYPGTGEEPQRYARNEAPACLYNEPALIAIGLLCGLGPQEGEAVSLAVEAPAEFRGREVRSLAATMTDGRVLRLLVDPDTYLPVAQTKTSESAAGSHVLETIYEVDAVARAALPPDFFDPRSLGYVPQDEVWLRILDATDLGMPVFWPGRVISGAGTLDAVLTRVDDRRGPRGKETPGHVLSLDYEGVDGRFRLDYWPEQTWEAFLQLMGDGFLWATCAETAVSQVPAGELTLLRGHEPQAGMEALRPQVGVPGPGQPTPAPFNPFPNGCPEGAHDRFMAAVRVEGGVVTINVPYGYCCQDGASFGAFDSEDGMRAIAERLRLRKPGE